MEQMRFVTGQVKDRLFEYVADFAAEFISKDRLWGSRMKVGSENILTLVKRVM